MAQGAAAAIERAYREEWTALLATLAGQVGGDIGLAEEAVADAFAAAAAEWPERGVPAKPGGWLTTVARRRAIDALRRDRTRTANQSALEHLERLVRDDNDTPPADEHGHDRSGVADDRLRLLFTCCHPALALEGRVALTLRAVGGLEVAEVARAFLTSESTMYQRLGRAKKKVQAAARSSSPRTGSSAGPYSSEPLAWGSPPRTDEQPRRRPSDYRPLDPLPPRGQPNATAPLRHQRHPRRLLRPPGGRARPGVGSLLGGADRAR